MDLAPIILFCYNRPEHTKKTIEALKNNELAKDSIIYIFLDGPKKEHDKENIRQVERIIENISGFKEYRIFKSKKNKGLANSIISGVSQIINKHEKVIVLEDDIVTSFQFLTFMNEALEYYEYDDKIYSVGGYNIPIKIPKTYNESVYLSIRAMCWGWGTWKNRWEKVDWEVKDYSIFKNNRRMIDNFNQGGDDLSSMLRQQVDGKLDSWYIRWTYNQYKLQQYSILPTISLVNNIGFDNSGVHCGKTNRYDISLNEKFEWKLNHNLEINEDLINNMRIFFSPIYGEKLIEQKEKMINTYQKRYNFTNKWISSLISNKCVSELLIKKYNIDTVSIYGYGIIGQNLYKQLKKENLLNVHWIVEEEEKKYTDNISCISLENYLKKNKDEILVISLLEEYDDITKKIKSEDTSTKVISIEECMNEDY
ncbi:hypothetical protein CLPUN_21270 [Clostridium puniceum]|uniref:Glycosyltransferase 2-like domain-containing protein n=1 Tax=Clostridium puniceum TaxID=29367 RepID=A0A1S8TK16_9CLOT|nr:glycosyltransferase [Clostridium puniceum]OOM77954.1 hypothetical protein CLPUN_21270 [Clostridium puniceum]